MRALIPAVLAIASLGAFCAREKRPPAPSASATDLEIQLAPLSAALSEPERLLRHRQPDLERDLLPPGRGTAGRLRPEGRRVHRRGPGPELQLHRARAAALRLHPGHPAPEHAPAPAVRGAAGPGQRPLSVPVPAVLARVSGLHPRRRAATGIEGVLQALEAEKPSEAAFEANLQAAYKHVEEDLKFPLRAQDRMDIRNIYRVLLRRAGGDPLPHLRPHLGHLPPDVPDARSTRAAPAGASGASWPRARTTTSCAVSRGPSASSPWSATSRGRRRCAPSARWVREHGLTVSAFYTSNVEFYLMRDRTFPRFVANVRELPSGPDSVIIRVLLRLRALPPGRDARASQRAAAAAAPALPRAVRRRLVFVRLGRLHGRLPPLRRDDRPARGVSR